MDRRSCSLRWPAIVSLLALAAALAGCKSVLESFALLSEGYDVAAEYDGLKDQKVAIVCKTVTMEEYSNTGAAKQLTEAIAERLKANAKKIHLIDPQKVAKLVDEKGLEDPIEIGKRLKADKVVAIDIESFSVLDGQTLYRGRSQIRIRVLNVETKEVEWNKQPSQIEWPTYGPTPMQDNASEAEFRNKFIAVMAEQIGRYFYAHDRYSKDDDNNH